VTDEVSPAGSEILREAQERGHKLSEGDAVLIEAVTEHLARAFGDHGGMVFDEIVSPLVHIDVYSVPACRERDWTLLVTSGMAERPMTAPDGMEAYRLGELLLALPPEWPLDEDSLEEERWYWPIRLLKQLARLPHENDTFLWHGHTVANDPPCAYDGTEFYGSLLAGSRLTPEEFDELTLPDGCTVYFHAVYPLHREELAFKLELGCDALLDRFVEHGVTEKVDVLRPSVVA
jgi:Suppressor of fused protein (SUFU)